MKIQSKDSFHLGVPLFTVAAGICLFGLSSPPLAGAMDASTADHTKFDMLNKPFAKAQDVTRACLSCHNKAGKQVQQTYHWTWQAQGGLQKGIGKKNVLNNF